MKKLMMLSCVLAMSAVFVGCNKAPKLPEDTLVAVYVDIPQAAENVGEFLSSAVDQLPESKRDKAKEMLKKIVSSGEDDFKALEADWLVLALCGDKKHTPRVATVIKCNFEAEIPSFNDKSLKDFFVSQYKDRADKGGHCGVGKTKINSETVYVIDGNAITFVEGKGGKYVIICQWNTWAAWEYYYQTDESDSWSSRSKKFDSDEYNSKLCDSDERGEKMLSNLIDIYRDDEGDVSKDFDDLNKLDGDAVARVQTAKLKTLLDAYGFKDKLEKFAEKSGDEDFIEDVLEAENATFDIMFSGNEIGYRIEVEAGSKDLAKAIEGVFNIGAVIERMSLDSIIYAVSLSDKQADEELSYKLRKLKRDLDLDDNEDQAKAVSKLLREGTEVDRSGSFVSAETLIDTDDLLAQIVPLVKDDFVEALEEISESLEDKEENDAPFILEYTPIGRLNKMFKSFR
jgi:hypothetical protein